MYTPTIIQKIRNNYFIVDCWHHRIIYNDNLRDEIADWKTLTEDINGGHTIDSDGELYFCDDTESGAIKIFSDASINVSGGVVSAKLADFQEDLILSNTTNLPKIFTSFCLA